VITAATWPAQNLVVTLNRSGELISNQSDNRWLTQH
jgi:hypothetical protein